MATPTSAVHICNLALDRLGQAPISSIESPTLPVEHACARHYDQTRRELLRERVFNFAKKLTQLTPDPSKEPAFGFTNAYLLPNDFIRLLSLGNHTLKNGSLEPQLFEFSEGYLFTDYADDGDTLSVGYIHDAKTVAQFDALFIKVLVLRLAKKLAPKLTLKPSVVNSIDNELKDADLSAAAVAGQEDPPRRVQRSKFRDVRRRSGVFRDNRFV